MKNKVHDVSTYTFEKGQIFLIDANVWLYIAGPSSNSKHSLERSYSAALKRLLESEGKIVINSLILSEYLNRYCRLVWEALHKTTYPTFKNFRRSPEYSPVGQDAQQNANMMLQICDRSSDHFESADMEKVFASFGPGISDFNDGLMTESCSKHGWTFITHDADFVCGGIDVLTANNRLISTCAP